MEILTLRCKRVFIQQILSGEKTSEFRASTKFYQKRLFSRKYGRLRLFDQWGWAVEAEIIQIIKIRRPRFISKEFVKTSFCYRIDLKNPVRK